MSGEVTSFYSLEAERTLLGAAIQDPARCLKLITELKTDEFYDKRNQKIHICLIDMERTKTGVDLISVDHWLATHVMLESIGGTAYLLECVNMVVTTVNAYQHVAIIHECSVRRNLYLLGKALMDKAGSADTPDEIREWAARSIKEVKTTDQMKLITMQEACMNMYEKLSEDNSEEEDNPKRIYSGIESLDRILGGLKDGEYVAVGARPSVGKSIFALQYCINAALAGKRVLLSSLEMSDTQIAERVLASCGSVPLGVITSGHIQLEAWTGIAKTIGPVSGLPLWICLEGTTVERIRKAAYQIYEDGGLDLIALDYLQLMEATYSKRQNRQEQIAEISRGLRLLSQELKIPVLVLTQLNRSSVKGSMSGKISKREPTMAEARESGAIEQDANIFLLLHDPDYDEMTNDSDRQIWNSLKEKGQRMMRIIVDKNRQGKRGRCTVAFDGDHMRFVPIVREQPF